MSPFRFRVHELLQARRITKREVSNPLATPYWGMTPSLFGIALCKFFVRPTGPPVRFNDRATRDFLRENLVRSLGESEASFDFCVQLRTNPASMPIEDPTIEWPESESPFIPVAKITIPKQFFDTPERVAFGEALSFTPWHGLEAHCPLGGINRVRRVVYETVSKIRHELNRTPRFEPPRL